MMMRKLLLILLLSFCERSFESICSRSTMNDVQQCVDHMLKVAKVTIEKCYSRFNCTPPNFLAELENLDKNMASMINRSMECGNSVLALILNYTNKCVDQEISGFALSSEDFMKHKQLGSLLINAQMDGAMDKYQAKTAGCASSRDCVKDEMHNIKQSFEECTAERSVAGNCSWNETTSFFCQCILQISDQHAASFKSNFQECLGSENENFAKNIMKFYEKNSKKVDVMAWCQNSKSIFEERKANDKYNAEIAEFMKSSNTTLDKDDLANWSKKLGNLFGKISVKNDKD